LKEKRQHGHAPIKTFNLPSKSLGELDPEAASSVITAASDIALVVDRDGKWLGQPWADTVTTECRGKIEELLRDAASKAPARARQVNHPSSRGADVPVAYSAVQVGDEGRVVAVGRDLRSIAALQQRLVEAQQSMERDYWRLRHVETRYRLLFQMAKEAVVLVDSQSLKVVEGNPAATELLGGPNQRIVGRALGESFDAESEKALQSLLIGVRVAGRGEDVRVRLRDADRQFLASASIIRHESTSLFLVRLAPVTSASDGSRPGAALMAQVIDSAPDSFVVTDPEGRILAANAAFVELAQLASEEQARGESLDRWLGRPGVDLNVMISNLRQYGALRLFATTLRDEAGAATEVEISAVSLPRARQPCMGFTIRNVGRRLSADPQQGTRALPRSVEQLTELVGRVPLKDLVREATDRIEQLCIEAALELTRNNRASAAEMLGLSRQSLYVKLRRFGLGDPGDTEE